MKRRTTFLVVAFAAMFALSTPAEAQWGSLINSARKAAGIKTKKEKAADEQKRKQDSIQTAIKSITPTIPLPAASGAPIAIRWQNQKIGEWDPVKLEITFNQTYDEGELAGQKVCWQLNPETGKFTSKNGTPKGSISNDGTIESPNLGTLKFDAKTGKVLQNGEAIGEATMLKASSYGNAIGSFDGHVSPLLVAYTFHGSLISQKQVAEWKEVAKKRAEEAAVREAKAREERAAREEALKKEWAELNVTIEASNFSTVGRVRGGTVEDSSFRTIGRIKPDGTIEDGSFRTIGRIKGNTIEDGSFRTIGRFDGRTFEDSSFRTIGRFSSGTVEDSSFRTIGRIKGTSNQIVVAACFYYFFFTDQLNKK